MADLKYDTDTMRGVATKYRDVANRLRMLGADLKKQIVDLKNVHWKSNAGTAFQNMYEEGWMNNVEKYILVLQEMAKELDNAALAYDMVTDKLKEIDGISV